MEAPRRVLLFGLSANPPTGARGHMGLLAHCRALRAFDEVWVLPVFQHIYASKRRLAPFRHRVAMLRLAVQDALCADAAEGAEVVVSEYERELFERMAADGESAPRVGSIDLVSFLLDKHKDARFTMLVGADAYADLVAGKWKRGDELRSLVDLLVIDRAGVGAPSQQQEAARGATFLHVPQLGDVSSTKARAAVDADELAELVTPSVAEYIQRHKLYGFAVEGESEE